MLAKFQSENLSERDPAVTFVFNKIKEVAAMHERSPEQALAQAIECAESAKLWLISLDNVQQTLDIENMAEMLVDYLKRIKSECEEAENLAKAISLRCAYRIGQQLIELKEEGKLLEGKPKKLSECRTVTLKDLSLKRNHSSDYQSIAAIPEEEMEEIVKAAARGEAVTKTETVRRGRKHQGKKVREIGETKNKGRLTINFSVKEQSFVKSKVKELYPDVTEPEGLRLILLSFFNYPIDEDGNHEEST